MDNPNHPARKFWRLMLVKHYDETAAECHERADEIAQLLASIGGIFPDEIREDRETYG